MAPACTRAKKTPKTTSKSACTVNAGQYQRQGQDDRQGQCPAFTVKAFVLVVFGVFFALVQAGAITGLSDRVDQQARINLTEKGLLIVEVGNSQVHVEALYPEVDFAWLDFERGGHGVFMLTAEQCRNHQALFASRV